MTIKIESNIPLPGRPQHHGDRKHPLHNLEVGQSFFLPSSVSHSSTRTLMSKIIDKKFISRSVTERGVWGVRIWRIA